MEKWNDGRGVVLSLEGEIKERVYIHLIPKLQFTSVPSTT